jgi:hypothetical protein
LIGLLALAASRAVAADSSPAPQPPREDCAAEESVSVDIDRFRANPSRYAHRCVRVRGLIAWRGLVRDPGELYDRSNGTAVLRGRDPMIALYGAEHDATGKLELWGARTYADIIAYAYSCDEFTSYVMARGGFMVSGLCHYRSGPVLWVSRWTAIPEVAPRLSGWRAARRHGNLLEVNERWRHFVEANSAVAAWFELVRTRDIAGLAGALSFLRPASAELSEMDRKWALRLMQPESPIAFLIGRVSPPRLTILLARPRGDEERDAYQAYGCVCRTDDCSGRWPFHSLDTEPALDHPYVCVEVTGESGQHPRVRADNLLRALRTE